MGSIEVVVGIVGIVLGGNGVSKLLQFSLLGESLRILSSDARFERTILVHKGLDLNLLGLLRGNNFILEIGKLCFVLETKLVDLRLETCLGVPN